MNSRPMSNGEEDFLGRGLTQTTCALTVNDWPLGRNSSISSRFPFLIRSLLKIRMPPRLMSEISCFDPTVLTARYKTGALTRGNCRLVITVFFDFAAFFGFVTLFGFAVFFGVVTFFGFVTFLAFTAFFDGVAFFGFVTFFGFFTCLLFPLKNMNLG